MEVNRSRLKKILTLFIRLFRLSGHHTGPFGRSLNRAASLIQEDREEDLKVISPYASQSYLSSEPRQRDIIIRKTMKLEQPVHAASDSAYLLGDSKGAFEYQPKTEKKEKKKAKSSSHESEYPDLDVTVFEHVVEATQDIQGIPITHRALNVLSSTLSDVARGRQNYRLGRLRRCNGRSWLLGSPKWRARRDLR
ncbi:hypothetical protein DL771_001569 [Monosporascus sp. 5C6A]|nr:hypothetical protein DL771_001569 [Monosporascus sp. 5C6A]